MKWIKSRQKYINEAKIGDVILPSQKKEVASYWGEKYLDLEEVEPTKNIIQGKWKLSQEDKIEALNSFFSINLDYMYAKLADLPKQFADVMKNSIDEKSVDKTKFNINEFDINQPTINQISLLNESIFKKIAVSESTADEVIVRDDNGRPLMDENNRPKKRKRNKDEVIFSKNLVNINVLIEDYNKVFTNHTIDASFFNSGDIQKIINLYWTDLNKGKFSTNIDVFENDLYLKIDHNPKDILNMSISRFFISCQHLYTGGYRSQLLSNVFDPNTIPAFLVFDTPIMEGNQVISEQLPLCRMLIRDVNTEYDDYVDKDGIYFDRVYPDRMETVMNSIVTDYSGNENTYSDSRYIFMPDLPFDYDLSEPYMDRLSIRNKKMIGINTKRLDISSIYDWNNTYISKNNSIKELIISSLNLPDNIFKLNLDLDWIIIKYIHIKSLSNFDKIKAKSWSFEKCIIDVEAIDTLYNNNSDLTKLKFINCEVSNLDLSKFETLEELHLIYTIDDSKEVENIINNSKLKKLVISTDLMSTKEEKNYFNSLKKHIKIETFGPKI
jgi:hypothetical protein